MTIPNFIPQIPQKSTDSAQKVVLSAGRMDNGDQKGFLRLIDIWKMVRESIKTQDEVKNHLPCGAKSKCKPPPQ